MVSQEITYNNNPAVFLVNQCQADPGGMSVFAPVVKPVRACVCVCEEGGEGCDTYTQAPHPAHTHPHTRQVGGNVLAHASCTRIHLKKGRDNQRVAKLVDSVRRLSACLCVSVCVPMSRMRSVLITTTPAMQQTNVQPSMPEAEAPFALTDGGVADV